jgi:KAP family P-loop domain
VADTTEGMPWKFLSDSAVQSSDQDRFGVHSAYAKVLYRIAKACETPFSIALYSSWGTGKTSICNLVQGQSASDPSVHYVYLDVWKYSNEPLKRWILLETHRALSDQGAIPDYKFGGRSLQSHLEFEESWEDHDRLSVNFAAVRWLGLGVVVFFCAFFASLLFSPKTSFVGHILTTVAAFLATGWAAAFLFEAVVKELFKSLSGLVFDRKVRHVSAQPAFSAEKFGEIFRDMIHQATTTPDSMGKRIVFVFDNLDRCSEAVAVETIGVIKTYLDEPGCVYIIPCDETALLKHISKSYTSQDGDVGQRYAREFLNKFFQTTLRLPIAPEFDIETFLDQQLVIAGMSDLPADARDVLVLGYLGQTPRQIKRVLNDLTAFRSLAVQAENQGLVEAGALTSNLSMLTKMSVISVEWPSFLGLLADDPELWADLNSKISTGERIDDNRVPVGLRSFLHATRHVSSDADIRPFIYLKRVDYERNQALATAVQNNLRKGQAKEFLALLTAAKSSSEQEDIVRIATDQTRRWLEAVPSRDVFLKNSASVVLKAAGTVTGSRSLELTVSHLLEYVMNTAKPADLAEIFPLPDLFAFSPTVSTGQKEKCLKRIASMFDPDAGVEKNLYQYWRQFLDHEEQLSSDLRLGFREFLNKRYKRDEPVILPFLFETSQRKKNDPKSDFDWAVSPDTLTSVASNLTFAKDEADGQRISVLMAFQPQMENETKNGTTLAIQRIVQGTRTRTFDSQAQAAIDFMNELAPTTLGQSQLDAIAAPLIEQVIAQGNYVLKAPWLAPLVVIRGALSTAVQASVDSLYRPYLQDPADPTALTQLLAAMTPPVCARLLSIPENVQALHAQTQRIESRLGATNAPPARERILNCFPASSVIDEIEIFDEERPWDLALFPSAVGRGRREKAGEDGLRKQIVAFIDRYLKGGVASRTGVLDQLLMTTKESPELLDETVARGLSECCIEVLALNVEKYFADLRFLSTKLSKQNRLWVEKEVASQFVGPREAQWVQVLSKISEDLAADEGLSADKSLVYTLMDHAFEAARVSPSEASGTLVSLFPHLEPDRARDYVDEAQDRLIALESSGEQISRMEPYLRMLRSAGPVLGEALPQKLATFCDRMLGPAKPEDEIAVVLSFLRDIGLPLTNIPLAERILELVPKEDALAEISRKVTPQSGPPEGERKGEAS